MASLYNIGRRRLFELASTLGRLLRCKSKRWTSSQECCWLFSIPLATPHRLHGRDNICSLTICFSAPKAQLFLDRFTTVQRTLQISRRRYLKFACRVNLSPTALQLAPSSARSTSLSSSSSSSSVSIPPCTHKYNQRLKLNLKALLKSFSLGLWLEFLIEAGDWSTTAAYMNLVLPQMQHLEASLPPHPPSLQNRNKCEPERQCIRMQCGSTNKGI